MSDKRRVEIAIYLAFFALIMCAPLLLDPFWLNRIAKYLVFGMLGVALRSMLRADAPLYLNPRFDGPRLRWLLGFARHCNWRDFEHAANLRPSAEANDRRPPPR